MKPIGIGIAAAVALGCGGFEVAGSGAAGRGGNGDAAGAGGHAGSAGSGGSGGAPGTDGSGAAGAGGSAGVGGTGGVGGSGGASGPVFYVSPNGSGTVCTSTEPCELSRIPVAAEPGDTWLLKDGAYEVTGFAID